MIADMPVVVYLSLPPYLRQWLVFRLGGGALPLSFPKGSPLSAFLRIFLRHKRENDLPAIVPEGAVPVVVPKFPGKDPQYFNYLPAKAHAALVDMVRNLFDVALFKDMSQFNVATRSKQRSSLMELWMEENGIEVDDRNFSAVAKRLQILRARVYDRERKKLAYKNANSCQ